MKDSVGQKPACGQPGKNDCALQGQQPEPTTFREEHGRNQTNKGEGGGDHESNQGKHVEGFVHL